MTVEVLVTSGENESTSQPRLTEMQRLQLRHARPGINKTGGSLTCFKNVAMAGHDTTSGLPSMELCTAAKYKYLLGLLVMEEAGGTTNVANNAIGFVVDEGFVNMDTSGFSAVDVPLWITGSGDFTETPQAGLPPVGIVKTKAVVGSGGCIYYNRNGVFHENAQKQIAIVRLDGISATAATKSFHGMATSGKCRVTRAYVLSDVATSGSSGAAEYRFILRNITDALDLMSASKVTSAAEIAVGTIYDLAVNQNQTISAGDKVLRCNVQTVGTPATDLSAAKLFLVIEYQPIP